MLSKKYCHCYKIMKTYSLCCRKILIILVIGSKKVIMANKVIRQVSKSANCVAEKSRFSKSLTKKVVGTRLF